MSASDGRVQWVDTARGVGIILVVLGHVLRGLDDAGLIQDHAAFDRIDAAIYLFHMPLFFALSGMFFERTVLRRGFWSSFAPRIESLLCPIVIWSYFIAISKVIAGGAASNPIGGWWEVVLYPFPPKDIFWFLWAMFAIQTIASILVTAKPGRLAYALLLAGSLALCIAFPPDNWPYLAGVIVEFLPYFAMGLLLGFLGRRPVDSLPVMAACLAAFAIAEALLFMSPTPPLVAYLAFRLLATVGALVALSWGGSRFESKMLRPLTYFGACSMAIYLMHTVVTSAVRTLLMRLEVDSVAAHVIVATLLGIMAPCAALWVIDRLRLRRALGLGKNIQPADTSDSTHSGITAATPR